MNALRLPSFTACISIGTKKSLLSIEFYFTKSLLEAADAGSSSLSLNGLEKHLLSRRFSYIVERNIDN